MIKTLMWVGLGVAVVAIGFNAVAASKKRTARTDAEFVAFGGLLLLLIPWVLGVGGTARSMFTIGGSIIGIFGSLRRIKLQRTSNPSV